MSKGPSLYGPSAGGGGGTSPVIQAQSVAEQFFVIQDPGVSAGFSLPVLSFTAPVGFNRVLIEAVARFQIDNNSGVDTRFAGSIGLSLPGANPPFGLDSYEPFTTEFVPNGQVSQVNQAVFARDYPVTAGDSIQVSMHVGQTAPGSADTAISGDTAASLAVTLTYFNA